MCPGHDLRSVPVWNAGQCQSTCNADCQCRSFHFRHSTCYLKSKACRDYETRAVSEGHDYVRMDFGSHCACAGRQYTYIHRQYKLCPGHDITTFSLVRASKNGLSEVTQCQLACSANCLCKSIQVYNQTCWLKNFACSSEELQDLKPPVGNDYVKIELIPECKGPGCGKHGGDAKLVMNQFDPVMARKSRP